MSIFVDTSVWYAAADLGDQEHNRATEVLSRANENLITSDHVLVETWLLMRSRLGKGVAETFCEALSHGVAVIESVSGADLQEAFAIGAQFEGQDFSIVDRTSFAMMQRLGLERAASFDRDFSIYRYGRDLKRAFEVLN